MGRRAKTKQAPGTAVSLASATFCLARCNQYAEKLRAAKQDELASVYDGFLLLLDEYCDDLRAGSRGQVLVDLS
jgi:hypothetical protein